MPPKTDQVTAEGAEDTTQGAAVEGIQDRRASVIDSIQAARLDMLREEGFDIPVEEDTVAGAAADTTAGAAEDTVAGGEDTVVAAGEDTVAGGEDTVQGAQPQLHTIMVDGEERHVTTEELLRNYQTAATANRRLEQASEILLRAKTGSAAPAAPADQPQNQDTAPGAAVEPSAELIEVVKGLQMDDPAEAAKKLAAYSAKQRAANPGAKAPDAEALVRSVMDRVEWQNALNAFGNDYQDILADDDMARFAGMKVQEVIAKTLKKAGDERRPRPSFDSMFKEAGDALRTKFGKPAPDPAAKQGSGNEPTATPPAKTPAVKVDTQARVTMKRLNPSLPTPARSAAPAAPNAPAAPESEEAVAARNSKTILEMQAQRRPQPIARRA